MIALAESVDFVRKPTAGLVAMTSAKSFSE